ncbi:MAG: VanZ family protein [Thermodesulfobacteriota bacterium]|nr:VanZ family protein [Thermodesulfobacteriota bacterium]
MRHPENIHPGHAFLVILACIMFLLLCNIDTQTSRVLDSIFEFGHFPLFGVISVALLFIFNHGTWPAKKIRPYVYALGCTILIGLATEIIQIFLPERFFELHDLFNDTLGAVVFLGFVSHLPSRAGTWMKRCCIVVICVSMTPIYISVADAVLIKRAFPGICSFETLTETSRWQGNHAAISRSREHATQGEHSMKVCLFNEGMYPGVSLKYLFHDWSGFTRLSMAIYLDEDTPLYITIRIHDLDHNNEYNDRFNRSFTLEPGINHLIIPLEEIRHAPHGRAMDMHRIENICIFSYGLEKNKDLFIDNLRLL